MLILTIFFLLFTNAFCIRKEDSVLYSRTTILTLLSISIMSYSNLSVVNVENGIGLYGGLFTITSLTQTITIFILLISCLILVYNSFYHRLVDSDQVRVPISIQSIVNISIGRKYNTNIAVLGDTKIPQYNITEYPLIILFIISGAVFFMSSADLVSLFISIELQSYGLYILCTLHRDSEQATGGGLTYFLLGGLSSCFILLGSGLLYINSGTTSLEGLHIITTISDIIDNSIISKQDLNNNTNILLDSYYMNLSLIIMTVGFLFKISAAPFHFWSPDVYDAIPTTVTTYVAIVPKLSILSFLLELVYYGPGTLSENIGTFSWKNVLLTSCFFSLIIGSILGLTQYRIKRVFAYSTISHLGFILLALSIGTIESIQAYLFYIISYTVSNLNAFITLVCIGYTTYFYIYKGENSKYLALLKKHSPSDFLPSGQYDISSSKESKESLLREIKESINLPKKKEIAQEPYDTLEKAVKIAKVNTERLHNNSSQEKDSRYLTSLSSFPVTIHPWKDISNSPIQLVNELKGFFYINSYLSLSLAITLFSFIGIPPLLGFFAKQMVLSAALDNGYIFITLLSILTSVIGAAYYLNIIKQMFFYKSDYIINPIFTKLPFSIALNKESPASLVNKSIIDNKQNSSATIPFTINEIKLSSILSIIVSILTLLLLFFIFIPNESFNLAKIVTLLLFM